MSMPIFFLHRIREESFDNGLELLLISVGIKKFVIRPKKLQFLTCFLKNYAFKVILLPETVTVSEIWGEKPAELHSCTNNSWTRTQVNSNINYADGSKFPDSTSRFHHATLRVHDVFNWIQDGGMNRVWNKNSHCLVGNIRGGPSEKYPGNVQVEIQVTSWSCPRQMF